MTHNASVDEYNYSTTDAAQTTSVHGFEVLICTESDDEQQQTQCAAARESLHVM